MLRHRESGLVLAVRCDVAATWGRRCRGWLGRPPADGDALWLTPCAAVHTAGMRAPIDVLFCGRDGRVIAVARALRPWRAAWAPGAAAACELPAYSAAAVVPGDYLDLVACLTEGNDVRRRRVTLGGARRFGVRLAARPGPGATRPRTADR
ncbi:MAG TPA: DUF192 domain-containing protein [bacterium]|nr:DUF192 domain-containing protein [bacterium]